MTFKKYRSPCRKHIRCTDCRSPCTDSVWVWKTLRIQKSVETSRVSRDHPSLSSQHHLVCICGWSYMRSSYIVQVPSKHCSVTFWAAGDGVKGWHHSLRNSQWISLWERSIFDLPRPPQNRRPLTDRQKFVTDGPRLLRLCKIWWKLRAYGQTGEI